MNVMVLGAGGMIGRAVCHALIGHGHRVVSVTRTGDSQSGKHLMHILADRADPATIRSALKAHRIIALVDMVAYASPQTEALLDVISGEIARYVLISSADVYRNYGLLHRRETGVPDPGLLNEDAPLRATRYPYRGAAPRNPSDPARWMDDYDKIPFEDAVRRKMPSAAILRLPMVFGDGDRQARFHWALAPILKRAGRAETPKAWLDWTTTYGHVGNMAGAVAAAVAAPQAEGGTFNLTDYPPVSNREWFKRFADGAGWTGDIVETTDPEHPIARATSGLDLDVAFRLSGEAFAKACNWTPPLSIESIVDGMIAEPTR